MPASTFSMFEHRSIILVEGINVNYYKCKIPGASYVMKNVLYNRLGRVLTYY